MSPLMALLLAFLPVRAQQMTIGILDFYGLERVAVADVRAALTIAEGDILSFEKGRPAAFAVSEQRLVQVPGIVAAQVSVVCCEEGRGILYVGVEEKGRPAPRFLPTPTGAIRLPPDIVEAGSALEDAVMAAVRRGDAGEDDSQGHALFHDPAARTIQQRFVTFAARDQARLRQVLRESSDADHRALAAEVLAYAANKDAIVDDLVAAMRDPYPGVRNNAMRALGILARAPATVRLTRRVPYDGFIALLGSLVWTDRNKSSLALSGLTASRNAALLDDIRRQALGPLADIARWKSPGHSLPALQILARVAGLPEGAAEQAATPAAREAIVAAAIARRD